MRKIEVLFKRGDQEMIVPFRSVRSAFEFVEGSIGVGEPVLKRSRETVNKKVNGDWLMVAATWDKVFFVRECGKNF